MRLLTLLVLLPCTLSGQITVRNHVETQNNQFPIVSQVSAASVYHDASEDPLLKKSAEILSGDIEKVSGRQPKLTYSDNALEDHMIIVGTIGNNPLIDQLIAEKKLDVAAITDQWERFIIQTIDKPFKGVDQALVIVGSDRRGAAFGVVTLSEKMGVSPWYWWADVPVKKSPEIYLDKGRYVSDGPSVKYRGIFINDEAPALRNWAQEKFGGFNSQFYEKVFELILRNRANYLWPAMWVPSMFYVDDPLNPVLADEYGIVIATTHHEPMMRAHAEWYRFNGGEWNYEKNKVKLQEFWRGGIERMGDYESVVTVGMRGDGDEAMTEETAVELMQAIIDDQRRIIEDVTGKAAEQTPQAWAVYKEVQDYYDKGMRVDEDILVLFCDDNWGNLRILPKKEDLDHKGGYGIYYHFDYVGAPVSYRWHNVTQIERVWEQMNLAYRSGVKDLWLVNVGDIKPMEFPISFFLDYAWNPDAIQAGDLPEYYLDWAGQQFGEHYTREIAKLVSLYTKYNARRTPEMLKPDTYSLLNYREADRIVMEYRQLLNESSRIYQKLPASHRSAYYQLVHSPIEMCCNLNEMYVAAGKNKLYYQQGRRSANAYADTVKGLFFKDEELTRRFHEELEEGKWNHIMSQIRIGYTSWNEPGTDIMPAVSYIQTGSNAQLGYMLEHGAGRSRRGLYTSFENFDPINRQEYYIEIFNRGDEILDYAIEPKNDWIIVSKTEGSIPYDEKVYISIDWNRVPEGNASGEILIKGAGSEYLVKVPLINELPEPSGFIENNGVVSIEAAHYTRKNDTNGMRWTVVPNLGRTHSSLIVEPLNSTRQKLDKNTPSVAYDFTVFNGGEVVVESYLSPTQNIRKTEGLLFALSIDDEEPQIINMNEGEIKPDWEYADWWMTSVGDHIKIKKSKHWIDTPGKHTLKIWTLDAGIVFQKFVIDAGGHKASYLGAPESKFIDSTP